MGRGLIRQRWQVTIPRDVREACKLFIGQNLTWDLVQEPGTGVEIRIMTGIWHRPEDLAAHQTAAARRDRRRLRKKKAKKEEVFRISDVKMSKKERRWLEGFMAELIERHKKGGQPDAQEEGETASPS